MSRHVYQSSKGGSIYVPLEVDGRIVNQTTPKFAKQVSSKYGNLSERKVQEDLLENHGRKISRTYIQTTTKAVNEIIEIQEQKWKYSLPTVALGATTVGIGLDGTTAYLVGQGYRETMSGTIGFFNEEGQRVHTIYVAQAPEYGKKTFKARFSKEIKLVKALLPTANYVGLADGAADNWTFLAPYVENQRLDFWHASEYLTPVSKVVSKSQYEQKEWNDSARHFLRYKDGGAEELLEDMISFRTKRVSKSKKEKLESSITYFTNHQHQMDYAQAAEDGMPIGSGVTEAACKVIVKERLCCSGMMWKEPSAQTALNIRTLNHTQGRWSQFWELFDLYGRQN